MNDNGKMFFVIYPCKRHDIEHTGNWKNDTQHYIIPHKGIKDSKTQHNSIKTETEE
jgi:hypothetical protein